MFLYIKCLHALIVMCRAKAEDSGGHPRGVRNSVIRTRVKMVVKKVRVEQNQDKNLHRGHGEPL